MHSKVDDEEYDELDKQYDHMRGIYMREETGKYRQMGKILQKDEHEDKGCLSEYERELKELTESIDLLKTWYIPRKKSEILKKKQGILSKKEQRREITKKSRSYEQNMTRTKVRRRTSKNGNSQIHEAGVSLAIVFL